MHGVRRVRLLGAWGEEEEDREGRLCRIGLRAQGGGACFFCVVGRRKTCFDC